MKISKLSDLMVIILLGIIYIGMGLIPTILICGFLSLWLFISYRMSKLDSNEDVKEIFNLKNKGEKK